MIATLLIVGFSSNTVDAIFHDYLIGCGFGAIALLLWIGACYLPNRWEKEENKNIKKQKKQLDENEQKVNNIFFDMAKYRAEITNNKS